MLDRNYQIDPNYLQTRHVERLRAVESARLAEQLSSGPGLKDRIYIAVGDRLISWGQRLKKETPYNDLCQDSA
jgi:hypothetical protein